MSTPTTEAAAPADFVVLYPEGRAEYVTITPGGSLRDALAERVPELASQGLGRLRMWFADDFRRGIYPPNPLANSVIARLGYPYDWSGPVALSMEEDPRGDIAPIPAEVRDTITELADGARVMWAPAQQHTPELLADLMYMDTISIGGRTIYQYKHHDTRRYLNLEMSGQAWSLTVGADGQGIARTLPLADAVAAVLGRS